MVNNRIGLLLTFNLSFVWVIVPMVLSGNSFRIFKTKVFQDLASIWWIPGDTDETSVFVYILRTIYIPFSAPDSALTHLGVSIWRGAFSSHFPAVTSMVGICPSSLFIRRFYYTFVNRFYNFHTFKRVNIFFLSNTFTIKYLNICLLAPTVGYTV